MPDILVSVSAGLFGLAGAGLLSRFLGPFLWQRRTPGFAPPSGLVALIPAHEEERLLPLTIRSIRIAAERARTNVRIIVGADACGDRTAEVARDLRAEVEILDVRSKWKTLAALAKHVRPGEWVALVDAGAQWPPALLAELSADFQDASLLAIAPAYFPRNASFLERFLWRLEAGWKSGENRAGGPVSVHGATVFFRAEALRAAFERLGRFGRSVWLNDDVALPFAARLAFPGGAVKYWCPSEPDRRVSDDGLRERAPQFRRRRRMVTGNLEWALTILPAAVRESPAAALVALRRLFRIFWAYWMLCFLYAPCFALLARRDQALLATAALSLTGALVLAAIGKKSLVEAAGASLLAPAFLLAAWLGRTQAWS